VLELLDKDKALVEKILRDPKNKEAVRDARTIIALSQLLNFAAEDVYAVIKESHEAVQEVFRTLK
jgi:hypothetical protein